MEDGSLVLKISAQTDDFVKKVDDVKAKCKSLSTQMAEIDKQMKMEGVDRVAKLAEKLELAKRAAAMAAKEADLYGEKIAALTAKHKSAEEMTDKEKAQVAKLADKMAEAQQKAKTYATQVDSLEKELNETGDAAEEAAEDIEKTGDAAADAGQKTSSLGDIIKGNVIASAITGGLKKVGDMFAHIAAKAWEAAKAVFEFAKKYAMEAVEMAADYQDALGYSEQVFEDQAEAVQDWVATNSVALRTNKSDLQGFINQLGSLYRSFGLNSEAAAKYSEGLMQIAVDLHAATGTDTAQIIDNMTSLMTGGYKAGYKYGIVINEAAVKSKALSMGLVDMAVDQAKVEKATLKVTEANKKAADAYTKYGESSIEYQKAQLAVTDAEKALEEALGGKEVALTQAQKEMAIYQLILEQTATSSGQAARESGSYKSQLDALKTTFDNLKLSIGEKLLPVFTELVTKFNEFIQTEEGQKMIDGLVSGVSDLADKVSEFVQSGKLEEWIAQLKEDMPGIIQDVKDFAGVVGDCVQPILDLYRAVKNHHDLKELDEAIRSSKTEVHAFAASVDVDMDTLRTAISGFAELNNLSLTEIYGNWSTYQPQIADYMAQTGTISEEMKNTVTTATSEMASSVQGDMNTVGTAFQEGITAAGNADTSGLAQKTAEVESFGERVKRALANFIDNSGWFSNAPGAEYAHRAAGGPVRAGQMYVVNDDHGRRVETFVPGMDGYILNGQDTQRIINNSTNNSRTFGDTYVYVNSYGTDAASIANEIGAEVNKKLRMAGAW